MPISNPTAETVFRELDPKQSCRAGTTAALPANTRTANVLTADANGALPVIDGVTLAVTSPKQRLLVQDEVAGANNGIYDVTDLGSGSTKWVLTRSADFDQDSEVTSGARTFVSEGTANIGKKFTLVTADPITLNTTSLTFDQTGGPGGDTDAIHDNVAAEISAITEKVTPIAADVVVIEDSADSNNKKRVQVANLTNGTHPVVDTTELVKGSADATKRIRFEVDGLTGSTLRVITMPDKDITLDDIADTRTPTTHAASHADGGSDEVPVAGLAEAAAPSNDVSRALRPDGSGGVVFSDVAFADLTGQAATAQIADDAVTNAKLANVATKTIKGRTTAATGDPEDLTAIQARAVLGITLDYFELDADQFEIPVSGDRPASIVRLAPTVPDSVNAGLAVNRYDATDEEARQFSRRIKSGALTMKLKLLWRAQTAPGDTVHDIGWKLYWREIPDGGAAPSATWAGTNDGSKVLTEIVNIADDVLFHEVEETITLLTESILLDREYQFLLSRIAPAGTDLVGDWVVRRLTVEID